MGRGVNKVILVGNLGDFPKMSLTTSGVVRAIVSLATSESWQDRSTGNHQERVEWHRVVFFGGLAKVVEGYLRKGSKIYVEGQLRTLRWEQDGIRRYATEIVARDMQMLDSNDSAAYAPQAAARAPLSSPIIGSPDFDDVPF